MATCDACAEEKDDCPPEGDANVCGDCRAFHLRAIAAATDAVTERYALFGSLYGRAIELHRDDIEAVVGVAVKAYCEYDER